MELCQTGWRQSAYNTPAAVSVTNDCLVITTYTEGGTNFTGFIDTQNKVAFGSGYYEARIQFSNAPGNWSAFWLQSPYNNGDPSNLDNPTNGVEIDIFEHLYVNGSGNRWLMVETRHSTGMVMATIIRPADGPQTNLGVATGFHTYGLLWTPNSYTTYVDGKVFGSTNYLISSAQQFLRLTSEVWSYSWAGTVPISGYPNATDSQLTMLVDYVRYYAHASVTNKWGGGVNNQWDTSTLNWTNAGTAVTYWDGDSVIFDDLAKTNVVNLDTTLSPGSLMVSNSVKNYTFTGIGGVGGGVALTKLGTGKLTLAGVNTYFGPTTINAGGTLEIGDPGSLGNGTYSANITNNGTLAYSSSLAQTLSGGISGTAY